jgi:alkylhydroperoxidase family enzyme
VGAFTYLLAKVAGRVAGTSPPSLFLTLGRQRRMFPAWLWFAATLMPGGRLSRRESEMVILRVAHLRRCRYEWEHLDAAAARHPRGRGHLHHHGDLDDDTWTPLREHLTEAECVELCMLAGHYQMLRQMLTPGSATTGS